MGWIAGQMANLDCVDGDIDMLMARIAHIRPGPTSPIAVTGSMTQQRGRSAPAVSRIGSRMRSHERITQRFVDRRSAFLVRQLASEANRSPPFRRRGGSVEGAYVGRVDGSRFVPDASRWCRDADANRRRQPRSSGEDRRPHTAPRHGCRMRFSRSTWAECCAGAVARSGDRWPGNDAGAGAEPLTGDFSRGRRATRYDASAGFSARRHRASVGAAFRGATLPLGGVGRGLVFQLVDALGCLPVTEVAGHSLGWNRRTERR